MDQKETKKNKILFVVGGILLAILVIGASFSYFQIVTTNNATNTTISGEGELVGQGTLSTNISQLKLNLTAEMMSKDNIGKKYYATETGEGVENPTLGNGKYNLATASLTESDVALDCTYSYDLSATTTKTIADSSDENLKVFIKDSNSKSTYTLKQLLSGVTHTGKIKNLTQGTDKTIEVEAYVENTSNTQNNLSGNVYTITITPKSGNSGFSCDVAQSSEYIYSLSYKTDISNMFSFEDFGYFVKVSDDTPLKEDLLGSTLTSSILGEFNVLHIDENLFLEENDYYSVIGEDFGIDGTFPYIFIVYDKIPTDYDNYFEYSKLETGIYIWYNENFETIFTLASPNYHTKLSYALSSTTNITDMTKVKHSQFPSTEDVYLVKVSDDRLSLEEVKNYVGSVEIADGTFMTLPITSDLVTTTENYLMITLGGMIGIVMVYNPTEVQGMSFTEPGMYILYNPAQFNGIYLGRYSN